MKSCKFLVQLFLFCIVILVVVSYAVARDYNWAPYKGTSKVDQNSAYQSFYFDTTAINSFKSYGGWVAYEHETQVYYANYADYGGYWGTNMPYGYIDSQALEPNPQIDNFTIGTTRPENMKADTKYWAQMSLKAGSSSSATVRVKGQLGYAPFAWCDSWAWCVLYPLHTTNSLITLTAPVSKEKSWTNP